MLWCSPVTAAAATTPARVAGITFNGTTLDDAIAPTDQCAVLLWGLLDRCVVPAEQRACAHFGTDANDIPAALKTIDIEFPEDEPTNISVLGHLAAHYPALVRSLRGMSMSDFADDESKAIGTFAALASRLSEMKFRCCGLTSLRALEGHCEFLRRVVLRGCFSLGSIDGLAHRVNLEEVDASNTGIASIEPLRSCPALTTVDLCGCQQLSSINALEDHQWLRGVNVTDTAITSIEPLRTCPALTTVFIRHCQQLSSMEALADHQWLQEVDASHTGIRSIEPLRSCPALKVVDLYGCEDLPADVSLPASVDVSR